jgi:hypothetical protein
VTPEAWTAIGVVVSAVAASLSAIAVARINATKNDVGVAKEQAAAANDAAVEARDLARPTGNGYADESRAAWSRIEAQLEQLADRQTRTNAWLTGHLADHARNDIRRHDPREELQP